MHGKKCPPLNPRFMHVFVIINLIIAVNNKITIPISSQLFITSVIWCSPENIVYGNNVPVIPKISPAIIHVIMVCFSIFLDTFFVNLLEYR